MAITDYKTDCLSSLKLRYLKIRFHRQVRTLVKRSWVRLRERRVPRGAARGSVAQRSRSLSTVQTTLLDRSPARRNSSIVSLCAGQVVRRSNSGASATQMASLRGSRSNISQLHQTMSSDVSVVLVATTRRSPKQNASKHLLGNSEKLPSKFSICELHSLSRSPSLLEEEENEVSRGSEDARSPGRPEQPQRSPHSAEEPEARRCPVVVFQKDDVEPRVDICINGKWNYQVNNSQDYETKENTTHEK